tara:strand:- start:10879 stop:11079 length:201 start_codon:yes stop_codon:yes gene_type:complete
MAWEDRTTFETIEFQFGLREKEVVALMRKEMKPSSFKIWSTRIQDRKTKNSDHLKKTDLNTSDRNK